MNVRVTILLGSIFVATANPVVGQRVSRPNNSQASVPRTAQPQVTAPNPFLPESLVKQPTSLACEGYCVVSLVKEGAWFRGDVKLQAAYDGQLYRFADSRKLAIFAADPQAYAPVLGGDCVVSLAQSRQRVRGSLQRGIVYGNRLYFLKSQAQLDLFNTNPERFRDADLALAGKCPIMHLDVQQEIQGNPKSETVVSGWRFCFAGEDQRRTFLSNADHYLKLLNLPVPAVSSEPLTENQKGNDSTARRIPARATVAVQGYCLVSLLNTGDWQRGLEDHSVEHEGKKYLFADEQAKAVFAKKPDKYAPANSGLCPVALRDRNERTAGSIHHLAEFEGLLYLLAGPEEKRLFLNSPERYTAISPKNASPESPKAQYRR